MKKKSYENPPEHTKGYYKLWRYFVEITKKQSFKKEVLRIRKICDIPPDGYFDRRYEEGNTISNKNKHTLTLTREIKKLCEKYSLLDIHWWMTFEEYILYSEYLRPNLVMGDLITILDKNDIEVEDDFFREVLDFYPVMICVNPKASNRELIDWVKKNSYVIRGAQDKYTNKNSRIGTNRKQSKLQESIRDYIYENKDKPLKVLSKNVEEIFGVYIDEGNMGKKKSLEMKRRK